MNNIYKVKMYILGYDIFISYSRKDSFNYAYAVAEHFMNKGYECYIDQISSLGPGERISGHITKAIKRSKGFILICSKEALRSQDTDPIVQEIDIFLQTNGSGFLIPIKLFDDTLAKDKQSGDSIVERKIKGLPLIEEAKTAINPSSEVLGRIETALKFTKKSRRLRNTAIAASIFIFMTIGLSVIFTLEKVKEVNSALKQVEYAKREKADAEVQTKSALSEAKNAESQKKNALNEAKNAESQKRISDSLKLVAIANNISVNMMSILQASRPKTLCLSMENLRAIAQNSEEAKKMVCDSLNNYIVSPRQIRDPEASITSVFGRDYFVKQEIAAMCLVITSIITQNSADVNRLLTYHKKHRSITVIYGYGNRVHEQTELLTLPSDCLECSMTIIETLNMNRTVKSKLLKALALLKEQELSENSASKADTSSH